MRVLLVEDDELILEGLFIALRQEGYEVTAAKSCAEAFAVLSEDVLPDICLLDVMLPDGDGYQVCQKIRQKSNLPILFLTACEDEIHTVLALELGADDYIVKPFRIRELTARMKAVLRRMAGHRTEEETVISVGKNKVYPEAGRVYAENEAVQLTAMEYRLLMIFISNRGRVLTREQILNNIWDDVGEFVNDNTLSVTMKRIREKLDDAEGEIIRTVRGIGYRLEA